MVYMIYIYLYIYKVYIYIYIYSLSTHLLLDICWLLAIHILAIVKYCNECRSMGISLRFILTFPLKNTQI